MREVFTIGFLMALIGTIIAFCITLIYILINNYDCSKPYYDVCIKEECTKMPNYALNYALYDNFILQPFDINMCKCLEWKKVKTICYERKI